MEYNYKDVPCCIRDKCQELVLSDDTLRKVMTILHGELEKGLGKNTNATAIVKCFVTYVQDLPDGTEQGKFLALDLGGTNFRVILIELDGDDCEMTSKIYEMSQELITGPGKKMFEYIAQSLSDFIEENQLHTENLPLGFTFSFPCRQMSLTEGRLERWTKGFNCPGVVGEDVTQLLKEAIEAKQIKIDVMAILNDTTGTLMSCAWKNHSTFIGLIVGTGTNACYVESIDKAELFEGDRSKPHVIINTEWGAFGDDGSLDFIRTEYDEIVDKNSINPGKQKFEKMISGMYMGELARLALLQFAKEKLFLNKSKGNWGKLATPGAFPTKFVSMAEKPDDTEKYYHSKHVMRELGISDDSSTEEDLLILRYVCEIVSTRAANLASAGIATLVNRLNRKEVMVGIDGTVYRLHPHFADRMLSKCRQLVPSGVKVDMMLSHDGSGRGAALVAAVAKREVMAAEAMKSNADIK